MKKLALAVVLFCLIASTASAHVLEPGWWNAPVEDLREARNQIRLFLGGGQGELVEAVLDSQWKNSTEEELRNAEDQLTGVIGDSPAAMSVQIGESLFFGHYEQDNDTSDRKEAIEWIVLDVQAGKALLLSRHGLDAKPYHERTAVTWEECTLRAWLNGEFLEEAFDLSEQSAIQTTKVDNSDDQGLKSLGYELYNVAVASGGNDTEDKVFLLSVAEAAKYFDAERESDGWMWYGKNITTVPTAYAIAEGAYSGISGKSTGMCYWWLRSPGLEYRTEAAFIYPEGSFNWDFVWRVTYALCPALWVDLSSLPL